MLIVKELVVSQLERGISAELVLRSGVQRTQLHRLPAYIHRCCEVSLQLKCCVQHNKRLGTRI